MQLENPSSIRQALALATCAVLTGNAHGEPAADGDWKADTSLLYYSEQDRVTVVEPVVFATRQLGDEETVTYKAVFDSMTGASPNGATPTDSAQTFTSASGGKTYTAAAGETPMRDFRDQRVSVGADWSKRTSPLSTRKLGGTVSVETDYVSTGGSLSFARDFNDKLTTLAFGLGLTLDLVQPTGGAPTGLQPLSTESGAVHDGEDDDDEGEGFDLFEGKRKTVGDVMVGLTQVLSRRTLMQVNYTHGRLDGYLTDPYKVLSVVSPTTGETLDYVHEKRPDARTTDVLYWKLVHHFGTDVAHLSYRHFRDDWGIRADTAEVRYHWKLGDTLFLEPQARYYTQTAAYFSRHSLVQGETVDFASADLRLGEMSGTTFGLKVGAHLFGGDMSFRYARMRQEGDSHPGDAVGIQRNFDLYPTLQADIVTLSYSTTF